MAGASSRSGCSSVIATWAASVKDMKDRVDENVKLAVGDEIGWSGEFENQERAMKRLAWIVPLSIGVIFLLLFDAFQSFRSALLIISNIPLALIGGILALWITGVALSVSAAIGFIALFGQAVLNGVVMVTYFNQLRAGGLSPEEAVVKGSLLRLRTVLMTAMLAMLGLLPMALSREIGSETPASAGHRRDRWPHLRDHPHACSFCRRCIAS